MRFQVQGGHLVNMSFVDNMLLFSRSASDALQMFQELEEALLQARLTINKGKAQFIL